MNNTLGKRSTEATVQNNDSKKPKTVVNDTLSVSRSNLKRLVQPKSRKKTDNAKTKGEGTPKEALAELTKKKEEDEKASKEKFYECPGCSAPIKPPYPPSFQTLIDETEQQKLNYEKAMRAVYDQEVKHQRKEMNTPIMPFILRPYVVPDDLKGKICRTHKLEYELKPMGKEKGYPESIDFNLLAKRVEAVCQKDLDQIVKGVEKSDFLNEALQRFKELGVKARRADHVVELFQGFLPGYYGPKGSSVMMDKLNDVYLKTGKVSNKTFRPLTAVEFLQQVLIPECGLRLIRQDYNEKGKELSLEKARKLMRESTEYGNLMFPKEEDIIESERTEERLEDDDDQREEKDKDEGSDRDDDNDYV